MNIRLNFLLFAFNSAIILISASYNLRADACADCDTNYQNCRAQCLENSGCLRGCAAQSLICKRQQCPLDYALRNASVYETNFFRSDGSLIGTREGVSPDRLEVEKSDFPITAAYAPSCPKLNDLKCEKNDNYQYVIEAPGCYVLWHAVGHYYTTSEICYLKDSKAAGKGK